MSVNQPAKIDAIVHHATSHAKLQDRHWNPEARRCHRGSLVCVAQLQCPPLRQPIRSTYPKQTPRALQQYKMQKLVKNFPAMCSVSYLSRCLCQIVDLTLCHQQQPARHLLVCGAHCNASIPQLCPPNVDAAAYRDPK